MSKLKDLTCARQRSYQNQIDPWFEIIFVIKIFNNIDLFPIYISELFSRYDFKNGAPWPLVQSRSSQIFCQAKIDIV